MYAKIGWPYLSRNQLSQVIVTDLRLLVCLLQEEVVQGFEAGFVDVES